MMGSFSVGACKAALDRTAQDRSLTRTLLAPYIQRSCSLRPCFLHTCLGHTCWPLPGYHPLSGPEQRGRLPP